MKKISRLLQAATLLGKLNKTLRVLGDEAVIRKEEYGL